MKILFISPAYPPIKNAIGEYVRFLALELLKNNHEVGILTKHNSIWKIDKQLDHFDLYPKQIKFCDNGIDIFPWIQNWKIDFNKSLKELQTYYKADIISFQYEPYSYQSKGLPFFLVKCFKNIFNRKITITFHEVYARNYLWDNKLYYIISFLQKKIAQKLFKLSFISFTAIDLYMKVFKDGKIKKLYIGSNINTTEVITNPERLLFFTDIKLFKFVSFGIKDYDIVLDALRLVKSKISIPFEYHIVGDLSKALSNKIAQKTELLQIKQNVYLHGFMKPEELAELFSKSHLFIDNNYVDNNQRGGTTLKSGSLAAAYQHSLPILGYYGDMTDTLLIHKKNIWFCENSTPIEIFRSIHFLISKPDILDCLQFGSNDLYNTYLSWSAIAKKFTTSISEKTKDIR